MRNTKVYCLVFALLVSLVAAQSVFAATPVTVEGVVVEKSDRPNMIVIDNAGVLTEVYGIKFNYLENQYNIVIEEGITVSVEAYDYVCKSGDTRLMASSITVGDVTVTLRPLP